MNVLLVNDDGIFAPGLRAIFAALRERGHTVNVAAPMEEKSGVSHCLTVYQPLRIKEITENNFEGTGVFGTPADCVKLALGSLLEEKPDMVIAGINRGPNAGPDIFYSGTIGGAAEGAQAGLPSMALSHACHGDTANLEEVARHAAELAEKIDWPAMPSGTVINVNYPDVPLAEAKGPAICPQSPAPWGNLYTERHAPGIGRYWWLTGMIDENALGENTDRDLLFKGYITITPLKFAYTHDEALETLKKMKL